MDRTAIANLGMGWLGADRITGFDAPTTKLEQLLADQFDGLRDATLEARDWTFATDRLQLQIDAAAPAFGYDARYLLPSTVIRVITVTPAVATGSLDGFAAAQAYRDGDDPSTLEWVREGPYLLTRGKPPLVNVRAIVQVEDATRFSPGFCQAFAARIAADLCVPITNDRALAADLWKLYLGKLADAAANDGRQGRSQQLRSNAIARRRR